MVDERKRPRRHQTATERDVEGIEARRERDQAIPAFVEDEVTGQYQGDELKAMRSKRPTNQRLSRLEQKHDDLSRDVSEIKGGVGAILKLSAEAADAREKREQREAVERASRRVQVVPIIKALGVAIALVLAALVGRGV